jgi:hypothetical protein
MSTVTDESASPAPSTPGETVALPSGERGANGAVPTPAEALAHAHTMMLSAAASVGYMGRTGEYRMYGLGWGMWSRSVWVWCATMRGE